MNVGYVPQSWYLDNLDVAWKEVYSKDPCKVCARACSQRGVSRT